MDPARRHAPLYMFKHYADMSQLTGEPGEGWIRMECHSKKAYECGENIQEAVKGLALYARLGDDPLITSSLAIRMTDDALRRFDEEIDLIHPPSSGSHRETTTAWATILLHAEGLTIITLRLHRDYYRVLDYNLVYDHKRASLSIIEHLKAPDVVSLPIAKRTCNGDYELFRMAFDRSAPVLCVFSPARAGTNPAASPWKTSAWKMRKMRCSVAVSVEVRLRHLTFSFQGKGFWVDLMQGLEYCDLEDTAAAGGDDDTVLDLGYIELPSEHVLDLETADFLEERMEATRTMGCGRDSIWFVCIDESISGDCADNFVSMWTLKLHADAGQWKWKNEAKFSLKDLWRFDGFKEAGLPEAPAMHPLLDAADGVLYLMLSGEYLGSDAEICWVDHMCSFDVRNKKLLWHGTVHDFHFTRPAAIPASCFFQTDPIHHHPAAGLALALQPGSKTKKDIRAEVASPAGSRLFCRQISVTSYNNWV